MLAPSSSNPPMQRVPAAKVEAELGRLREVAARLGVDRVDPRLNAPAQLNVCAGVESSPGVQAKACARAQEAVHNWASQGRTTVTIS